MKNLKDQLIRDNSPPINYFKARKVLAKTKT